MAARSGSEFLERLSAARVHVEIQGETLTGGVADHPAFRNVVRSYAELYDMQHDPAFPEILRKLGASGLMATPTEADITGPAAADIETYLQSATLSGADRVRLFRLVWDTCISAFSGRQALYEYYFFGDPVRMAGAYVASYDREPYQAAVQAFLDSR